MDQPMQDNRKKTAARRVWWIILIAITVVGGVSVMFFVDSLIETPKTYYGEGYEITLTDEFDVEYLDGWLVVYDGRDALAMLNRKSKKELPGVDTVSFYAHLLCANCEYEKSGVVEADGLVYYDYTCTVDGQVRHYRVVSYESTDAYWYVQFVAYEKDFSEVEPRIMEWAKSFKVTYYESPAVVCHGGVFLRQDVIATV